MLDTVETGRVSTRWITRERRSTELVNSAFPWPRHLSLPALKREPICCLPSQVGEVTFDIHSQDWAMGCQLLSKWGSIQNRNRASSRGAAGEWAIGKRRSSATSRLGEVGPRDLQESSREASARSGRFRKCFPLLTERPRDQRSKSGGEWQRGMTVWKQVLGQG